MTEMIPIKERCMVCGATMHDWQELGTTKEYICPECGQVHSVRTFKNNPIRVRFKKLKKVAQLPVFREVNYGSFANPTLVWECSACEESWLMSENPKDNKYNFCPACGVKFDEHIPYEWEEEEDE